MFIDSGVGRTQVVNSSKRKILGVYLFLIHSRNEALLKQSSISTNITKGN